METSLRYILSSLFLLVLTFKLLAWKKRKLPPSPFPSLPFLGHLHLLRQPLHRVYHNLSQNLGPIFSLSLGNRFVVVVSSPTLAEECFTKNDIVLANRPRFALGKYIGYNYTSLVDSAYGEHWRNLRRLTSIQVFSSNRLNMFTSTRHDEKRLLLRKLYKVSRDDTFARIELRHVFLELAFNNIMRMVAGKRYFGEGATEYGESKRFRELIDEVVELAVASNPGDFFPFLRWIGWKGVEKKYAKTSQKMDMFLQDLVDEHRRDKGKNTMIDHLLSLQESQPEYYTDTVIKGIIITMLVGGTDTTSATIEWAMSALLNHPEKLDKARAEIQRLTGNDRIIDESDLSNLPYLQNIISETFRLFPVAPLLIPHESSDDCTIGGYGIPRGSILFVNVWAIHREPTIWDDPTRFEPELFGAIGEVRAPKLLPFGMGRRSCPGNGLAQRVVGSTLGALIQCFEWQRIDEAKIDLTEGNGISMSKAKPLEAKCKALDVLHKVLAGDA